MAIQGGDASFHHIAAKEFFGDSVEIKPCDNFKNAFTSVAKKETSHALIAIENSLYGSINEVYDLLLKNDVSIVGEIYLRINQNLIVVPGTKINEIKEVHSHPVALAQCAEFLDGHLASAERFEHVDTALSAKDVSKWRDKSKAAIASQQAAKLYELEVLKENIETNHQNYTRFVVIKNKSSGAIPKANKSSLILQTKDDTKPGALHEALGTFARRNLNLTLIHSRPSIGKAWHYMFYVDVLGGIADGLLDEAINELSVHNFVVKLLGCYPSGKSD